MPSFKLRQSKSVANALASLVSLSLVACAAPSNTIELATQANNQCSVIESVVVMDDLLTINAGERPTLGYAVQLTEQTQADAKVTLMYQITSPPKGAMVAQMMTSPCLYVTLPKEWQTVIVINETSAQRWTFNRIE
ncbi:MAG: protease complex subunit PrcB family protein [Oleibacter sp.]|nr:protease complex subunit PrcB family protein [Thalassolituus sp.]